MIGIALFAVGVSKQIAPKPAATLANTGAGSPQIANASNSNATNDRPRTDAERLAKAKQILADNKRPGAGVVEPPEDYLRTISKASPEYKEAQKLLAGIEKENERIRKQQAQLQAQQQIANQKAEREAIIDRLESNLLKQGMDFYFNWEGPGGDTLRIKYVLMSRPVVYNITNETDFLNNLRAVGVKKVIFTDGYDESWSYNL
jgi:hypothetical protein